MFNHLQYVPILKWKLGEYQALSRLENAVKDRVTPLIEIPAVGYDFENSRTAKSLDDHLKDFGRRLKAKWPARLCFVDTKNIAASERLADASHPLTRVLTLARSEGCMAIPVVSLSSDADYRQELRRRDCWTNAALPFAFILKILTGRHLPLISINAFKTSALETDFFFLAKG